MSLSYFEIRNIQSIYKHYFQNIDKLRIFPWIEIESSELGTDYYKILIDDFTLNVQKKIKDRKVGSADRCGDTPMICIPEDRIQCIESIKKKYSYLLIEGNEQLCIDHLKERAFY